MSPLDLRTHSEKLLDAAAHTLLERERAAHVVMSSTDDPAVRNELLECLGLLEV